MGADGDVLSDVGGAQRDLDRAERSLSDAVHRAREHGHTWQEIGDVLGVSRQAAFKRFGVVLDPETAKPVAPQRTADVLGLAAEAFERIAKGDHAWVRERMTSACARQVTVKRIRGVWRDVLAEMGPFEAIDDATPLAPDGSPLAQVGAGEVPVPAIARLVLAHEAGQTVARVMVNRAGQISGMLVGPPEAEPHWPF